MRMDGVGEQAWASNVEADAAVRGEAGLGEGTVGRCPDMCPHTVAPQCHQALASPWDFITHTSPDLFKNKNSKHLFGCCVPTEQCC